MRIKFYILTSSLVLLASLASLAMATLAMWYARIVFLCFIFSKIPNSIGSNVEASDGLEVARA